MAAKKPRTRKIVTEETVEVEPETAIPEYAPTEDEELLGSVLSQFGGSSEVRLKLSRIEASGAVYVHTYPDAGTSVKEADEAFIQRVHGGGQYDLRFYVGDQLARTLKLNIAEPPAGTKVNASGSDPVIALLMQQNNYLQQQLAANRAPQQTPVGELASAVQAVMGLRAPVEQTPSEKMFEAFMRGIEFMKEAGPGSSGFDWKQELMSAGKQILPGIMQMLNNRPQAGSGVAVNPQQQPNVLPPQTQQMLQAGFDYLKKKAKAGKDAEIFVDLVMDNRDEELYAELVAMVCQLEFEQIASFDPEIGQAPYRAFFLTLYNGIRQAVAEEQQGGPVGQEEDAGGIQEGLPAPPLDLGVKPNGLQHESGPLDVDTARSSGNARNLAGDGGARPRRRK